jgi:hypothetical protein
MGDLSLDAVNDNWQNILVQLRQTNKMVEALIRSVRLVDVEGSSVIVEAPSDLLKGRIEQTGSKSQVEQSISQVMGVSVRLRCVLKGEYRPRTRPAASAPDPPPAGKTREAEPSSSSESASRITGAEDSKEDPMLEEALNLGAEIKNLE